ncbi:MAG: ABC transporter substrate-binding protein [Acidimicrobiales bacterium]
MPCRSLSLVALAVCGALLAAACGAPRPSLVDEGSAREVAVEEDPEPAPSVPAGAGSLTLAVGSTWTGDPADAGPASLTRLVLADLLFEGLTRLDDDGLVIPGLAESWTVSPDRLTWTFRLAPGIVDGAGVTITAADVVRSLDRIAARGPDDVVATALSAVSGWADRMQGAADSVAGLTAPENDVVTISLAVPFEPLLEVLASPAFGLTGEAGIGLRTTGGYRVDVGGSISPVDAVRGGPLIDLLAGEVGADALRERRVDWVPLERHEGTDDLPGDVVRVPLDVQVAIVVRLDDPAVRRSLVDLIDPVALATSARLASVAPRDPNGVRAALPASIVVDVPEGPLEVLGLSLAEQLERGEIAVEVISSVPAAFAERVAAGTARIYPVVLASGTWRGGAFVDALTPGGPGDVIGLESQARAELVGELLAEVNPTRRATLVDALRGVALDEGVLMPVGRLEALVGVSVDGRVLRHRRDGTLDLGL